MRHRPRPRAVLVADEGQDALRRPRSRRPDRRRSRARGRATGWRRPPCAGRGRRPRPRAAHGTLGAGPVGGVGRQPVRKAGAVGRVVREQHPDQAREVHVAARIGAKLAQQGSSIGPSASRRRSSSSCSTVIAIAARAAFARSGGGSQPRTASATAPARATSRRCSPRIVQNSPSAASSCTREPRSPSAIAPRSSSARLVSSAPSASTAANWLGTRQARQTGGRVADGPAALGGAGAGVLAGARELHQAELAYRLQHPVADPGRGLADVQQRLVDEAADRVDGTGAEHSLGRLERETVMEQRQPPQRALLTGVQQVPGPLDDREQGLMPVGSTAVAAAQQREPVLEPPVDLLDRHGAHPGRGELDRQRQAVEPADDTGHGRLGQAHARPRGDRPLAGTAAPRHPSPVGPAGRRARRRSRAERGWW